VSPAAAKEKKSVLLLKGDDDELKRRRLEEILAEVPPDFADFDIDLLEGDTATADRIIAGLNIIPFGAEKRLVVVRFANKMPRDEQERLVGRLDRIPATGCLVLVNPAVDRKDGKEPRGSSVIGDLSKAIRRLGKVEDFGKLDKKFAAELARTTFEKLGVSVDARGFALFMQRVGQDSSTIINEGRKLACYVGESRKVTYKDVVEAVTEPDEEKVFKLIDAVADRNQSKSVAYIGEFFDSGNNPDADAPRLLGMLARQFRHLWQFKMLHEAGASNLSKTGVSAETRAALPSQDNLLDLVARQKWQEDRLGRQAQKFSRTDLCRCFEAVAESDAMLKGLVGGIDDPRVIMELLVIRISRGR